MRISIKTILISTACLMLPLSNAFTSFGTAFRTSSPKTYLKMELFENMPAIKHDDVSTALGTSHHLSLDIGTAVISPQQMACL